MSKLSFEQILSNENNLIYDVKGISMLPLLKQGRCQVHIVPSDTYDLYDIVLYKVNKKSYILHRIINIKNDEYIIFGDNSIRIDHLKKEDILGKMVGYYEDGNYTSIDDDKYRNYLSKYILPREKEHSLILEDSNYFFNQIKEMYYELLRLGINTSYEINKDLFNRQMPIVKHYLYKFINNKKSLHLLGYAINKFDLEFEDSIKENAIHALETTKLRYIRLSEAKNEITKCLNNNQIKHMYLKGAEIREKYPTPFLRSSNDIDLFVNESDLNKVDRVFKEELDCIKYCETPYHVVYENKKYKLLFEVHYKLNTYLLSKYEYLLEDPFRRSTLDKDYQYLYHMEPNVEYLFHLSHLIRHIGFGEYWTSMILDTYILNNLNESNNELVNKAELETFNNYYVNIINSIFDSSITLDDKSLDLEKFLLKDTNQIMMTVKKEIHNSFFKYIIRRLFPSYSLMKYRFPILKKAPVLLPFCYIVRFFEYIFKKGNVKKVINQKNAYKDIKENEIQLLKDVGLYEYIVELKRTNKDIA